MTILQKLQLRQSEIREKLNTLLGLETRSEEQQGELEKLAAEGQKIEPELRAAIIAAPDEQTVVTKTTGDPEQRERLELRGKTGLADFFAAAAGGREVVGAAREYAASVGVSALNRLPLDIFPNGQPETRAVTGGPAIEGPAEPAVPFVFKGSAAASLGIVMPAHAPGSVQVPRVVTAPPADTLVKDASAPSTAAVIALDSKTPKRIAGSFEIRVEDLAIFPELETVLGEAIRGSLSNELDEEVFNGAATGLNGLFLQSSDVSVDGTVETFATGISRYAALVDGEHAYSLADLRSVVGPATYAKFAGLISDGVPLSDYLESRLGSFRVSNRMPSLASKGQKGIVTLTGGPSPIRIYVWSALEVVRDPFSAAGSGKVKLTVTALVSEVYVPHTTSQVAQIHPKLKA